LQRAFFNACQRMNGIYHGNDFINLFKSFKEVAYFKEVGFKFGRWLDLKFFELILD
jgi:L-amino acid N-acyltransferase YncA